MSNGPRVLIVGLSGPTDVGRHLLNAAKELGVEVSLIDYQEAFDTPRIIRTISWRLAGHRPPLLRTFSKRVEDAAARLDATHVVATGQAPIQKATLSRMIDNRRRMVVFLTDDPWSSSHKAPWFLQALPVYQTVYTPRRANIKELSDLGCQDVSYLPFAYSPFVHYPSSETDRRLQGDVLFVGGADNERIPYLQAVADAGVNLILCGAYWHRVATLKKYARGHIGVDAIRRAVSSCKVNLGLIRRSNRDGHSMRSFEVPAMRGCFLVERTKDHLDMFGPEGEAVMYFEGTSEMLEKVSLLLNDADLRGRLAARALESSRAGPNTYSDRLRTMLNLEGGSDD